jgi:AcrR family transcriptional regulator
MQRNYNSETRQMKAQATKLRVTECAFKLFSKKGFDVVTMEDIARASATPLPTVYSLFKSKSGILFEVVKKICFGEKYWEMKNFLEKSTDPEERLKIAARISRIVHDSDRKKLDFVRGVSLVSPEIKELEGKTEALRYDAQESIIQCIFAAKRQNRKLTYAQARDVMWTLTSWDIYRMLVVQRKWGGKRYETWLAGTLRYSLID